MGLGLGLTSKTFGKYVGFSAGTGNKRVRNCIFCYMNEVNLKLVYFVNINEVQNEQKEQNWKSFS